MTKIALLQSTTGIHPEANARALVAAVEEAASGGAEMLFTPEMSGLLDRDSSRATGNLRREENDPVLAAVREAAKRNRIWLSIGSLLFPVYYLVLSLVLHARRRVPVVRG